MQNYYLGLIIPKFILTYYLSLPYTFLSGLSIKKVLLDAYYIKVLLGV